MEYTNSQDTSERTRVYLTVSFDSYKKISTENMYYDKFGEGRIYYKYLTPRAILGATSVEILDLGRYKEADNNIKENIFCSLCDINDIHKKRLNNLDIEWTFETEDYSEDLKEFLKSTEMHMLVSSNIDAPLAFKQTYDVTIKNENNAKKDENGVMDMEEYEKYINRYVRSYHVLGVNKENGRLQMFYVLWNDYNSLKFVEENRDIFLIVSDYTILQ